MSAARWRWLGMWGILAALAVVVAGRVDWSGALAASRGANWYCLLLAVAANGAILPLATLQWRLLLPATADVPRRTMFGIVAAISSMSNGGPAFAGHATGVQLLATRGGIGHAAGVSVTILEQLTEALAKLALIGTAMLVVPGFQRPAIGAALAVAAPTLAIGLWLAARKGTLAAALESRSGARWAPIARFLAGVLRHLDALGRPGPFAGATALGLLRKVTEGMAIVAVTTALGYTLPAWTAVAALAAVSVASMVSVTPANLGTYEAAAYLAFRGAGVDEGGALALALVMHATYLIPLAGTGWLLESVRLLRGRRAAEAAGDARAG